MKEKLVTVAYFDNYIEADLSRQMLEDEGLKAFVMGQNVGNVYAGVPAAIDIQLQTPESQVEQARELLEAHRQEEAAEDAAFEQEDFEDDEPDEEEEQE